MTITPGLLAPLFVEAFKWLLRRFLGSGWDFSPGFYKVVVPVVTALMPFVMVFGLGLYVDDPILTLDLLGVVRYLVIVAINSLVAFGAYVVAIKPLKVYSRLWKEN